MITISAGHWGAKTGAHGIIDEGTENIKVAKEVVYILNQGGVKANYIQDTVNDNKNDNVNWLIAQHNKTDRQIDVQIHFNSSSSSLNKGIGTETLIFDYSKNAVAQKLSNAISQSSGLKNRGVKIRTDLGFLKRTDKPAYLIEVCFVNDSVDVALYRRDFNKICQAIAKVLAEAVGKILSNNTIVEDNTLNKQEPSEWAKEAIKWVKGTGISDGSRPQDAATREEVFVMLYRLSQTNK